MTAPATVAAYYITAIEALSTIANVHVRAGRFDAALRVLQHVAPIAAESDVPQDQRAHVLIQTGTIMAERSSFTTSQYDEALAVLHEAVDVADTTGNTVVRAAARNALGMAYYRQTLSSGTGTFEQPAAYFREALELAEDAGDTHGMCTSLLHQALVAERYAHYDNARGLFEQVRSLAEQHGYQEEAAEAWRHLGFAHARAGVQTEAQHCFERSLAIWEQLGMQPVLPFAHLALGECFAAQGQADAALAQYETAYTRANAVGNTRAALQTAFSIGELHEQQGNMTAARHWYEQTHTLAEAMQFTPGIARSRAKLDQLPLPEAG